MNCCHYFLRMPIFIILYCVTVNVLSTVIGIQERRPSMDMTKFEFIVSEVVQQLNPQVTRILFLFNYGKENEVLNLLI